MFQKHEILGPHIWQYIISLDLWSSVILDIGLKFVHLRKYILNFGHVLATPKFLENRQNGQ